MAIRNAPRKSNTGPTILRIFPPELPGQAHPSSEQASPAPLATTVRVMSEMTPVEASRTTSVPVPPALGETAAEAHRRVDLYDGLRGIAIVLVVLSHGWYLWPIDWIDQHAWVRPFFRSGNSGVTIFLVAAGFLMFRSLTARRPLFAMRADTTFVRRVARVGPSLWLFLVVAVVVAALDSSTDGLERGHRRLRLPRRHLHLELVPAEPCPGHLATRLRTPVVPVGGHAGLRDHGVPVLPAPPSPGRPDVRAAGLLPAPGLVALPRGCPPSSSSRCSCARPFAWTPSWSAS